MWEVSAASILIVMALCVAGVFSCKYDDSLIQRVGMFLLFIGLFPSLKSVWGNDEVHIGTASATVGLAAYAIGTACKAWKFSRRERRYRR